MKVKLALVMQDGGGVVLVPQDVDARQWMEGHAEMLNGVLRKAKDTWGGAPMTPVNVTAMAAEVEELLCIYEWKRHVEVIVGKYVKKVAVPADALLTEVLREVAVCHMTGNLRERIEAYLTRAWEPL